VNVIFQREKEQKMKARSGFTLVEILIVVVILGILAAIVIPQFTDASTEAKTSSLMTDLQTMRSQIELYKIQHNDQLPGAGTASFQDALTGTTDINGAAGGTYGPYVQQIPTKQFVNSSAVDIDGTLGGGWTADPPTACYLNITTGAVEAPPAIVGIDTYEVKLDGDDILVRIG
jgi:general secretion pathway protein G